MAEFATAPPSIGSHWQMRRRHMSLNLPIYYKTKLVLIPILLLRSTPRRSEACTKWWGTTWACNVPSVSGVWSCHAKLTQIIGNCKTFDASVVQVFIAKDYHVFLMSKDWVFWLLLMFAFNFVVFRLKGVFISGYNSTEEGLPHWRLWVRDGGPM